MNGRVEFLPLTEVESRQQMIQAMERALIWLKAIAEPCMSGRGDSYAGFKRDLQALEVAIHNARSL